MATRNIRNNNPGNLRPRLGTPWHSQSGVDNNEPDPPYAIFPNPIAGFSALAEWLIIAQRKGLNTPSKIIHVFAPTGDDNNPASYAAVLAKALGTHVDAVFDATKPGTAYTICKAISGVEGSGSSWSNNAIVEGIADAYKRLGVNVPTAAPVAAPVLHRDTIDIQHDIANAQTIVVQYTQKIAQLTSELAAATAAIAKNV